MKRRKSLVMRTVGKVVQIFSAVVIKAGCQLVVFISFGLLRSMWLVSNLQQTLTLKMSPLAYRHQPLIFFFILGYEPWRDGGTGD